MDQFEGQQIQKLISAGESVFVRADDAAARRCLEAAGWDFQQAAGAYMPPLPESPVVGRALATSNFKTAYSKATPPKGPMDFGMAVGKLVEAYCAKEGIPYDEDEGQSFFEQLQAEAMAHAQELASADQLPVAAQRMWTSAQQLREREFCFILNACVREDWNEAAAPLAKVTRAINKLCVSDSALIATQAATQRQLGLEDQAMEAGTHVRVDEFGLGVYVRMERWRVVANAHCIRFPEPHGEQKVALKRLPESDWTVPLAIHPPDNVCFRGGGFDDRYRSFFVSGRQFRQPAYLATSFSEAVARRFIRMRGGNDCVLWRVRIDPARKCVHVNLVKKSNVSGEEEYLFAPYSAFRVLSAVWRAGTAEEPHEIELLAAVDNQEESEGLPLAPWS
eukprot:COSAG04_NODE_823_length_10051_cov_18.357617_7_plen_392_part_00